MLYYNNDVEFVEDAINKNYIQVISTNNDTRLETEFKESIKEILFLLDEKEDEIELLKNQIEEQYTKEKIMLKHIKKLEKLLEKRKVNFKKWAEIEIET